MGSKRIKNKVEKNKNIKEAANYLNEAREEMRNGDVSITISLMRGIAKRTKISLKKIGTTEEKIISILREGHKNQAKKYLERARISKAEGDISHIISLMRNELEFKPEDGRIPIEEITSWKEIISIVREGHKNAALKYKKKALSEKDSRNVSDTLKLMNYQLVDGLIPIEEITTTEETKLLVNLLLAYI